MTISSASGVLDLVDGPLLNRAPGPGIWGLEKDGLEGWYEPAPPRAESVLIPQMHGGYWPAHLLVGPRILTIRGFHSDKTSAVAEAVARDRLAALITQELTVHVQDASGGRSVTGFLGTQPILRPINAWRAGFSLVLTCPDPMKYGREAVFPTIGNVITVQNPGTADTYPIIEVSGRVTNLTLTQGDRRVRWAGNATDLRIDTRYGIAYSGGVEAGGLIDDAVLSLPPGTTPVTVSVTSGARVQMRVRPAWH
ncbi:hypothetical protein [Lysinibacter sp. HNR]|uniref:hypothetical protein n=1 Tax=Lysinibacter sp. HNR TaxID=3031408 RepID=UPI002434C407|nr:hypothetical protein [Lysinibacter sp. HNR]WGD38471.1 hypothetical protein FrondiHNR_06060 [Lysinibacter sp. HNR]